ncbi:MAG: hypothetical protein HY056_15190 [Proteobacteria bacterium]|nr:hypothetical protein [Pseudomonadota bacterium]
MMVLPVVGVLVYVGFSILVGFCGIERRMGFTGTFILSLLLTPVIMLIVLLLTGPAQRAERPSRPQSN